MMTGRTLRRSLFLTSALIGAGAGSPAFAQAGAQPGDPSGARPGQVAAPIHRPHSEISLRANGDDARATLELFAPLAQNDRTLLFADLRVNARTGDSEGGGSVGVGLRRILNPDIMVGGYLAYDVIDSDLGGTYEALAFGAELLTRDHDFRLKFSEALSEPALIGRTILPEAGAIVIDGGRIFEQRPTIDFEQTPFDSIEAEFGARISALDLPTGHEFRVYAAAYNLSADNFDAEIGTRGRFEYRVDDAFGFDGARFILGGGVGADRFRDTEVFGEVRFRMPLTALFGGAARSGPDRERTPLYERMTERVARDASPVLRSTRRDATVAQAVRNPFSGEAMDKVVYVDAAGDGDGSRIDPTSLDGSIPLADENGVILVNGAGGAVETGGVALERGQQVVGAGGTVYVVRSDGALVEVDSGLTGPAVVRGTDAASAVFTLADNTLIRGLTIEGGLSGLAAQDIRRFQVSDVTVQGSAGAGLSLVGLLDTAFIESLTITGAGADGAAISGVEGALVVDGLTVTGAADDGVSVSGSGGAILFEDLVIDGAGVTGNGLVAQSVSGMVAVDGGRIENVAEDGVQAVDANLNLNAMTIVAGAGEAIDVTAGDADVTLSFNALTFARAGVPAPASTAAPAAADAGSSGRADAVWTPAQTPVEEPDHAAPAEGEADAAGARPASPEALETADFRGVENLDSRGGAAADQPGVTPAPAGAGAVSRETFDVGLASEAEPVAQTLSVQSAALSVADEGASVTTPVSAPESAPESGAAPAPFEPRRPDAPDQMNAHAVVTLTRREPASGAGGVTALDTPDSSVLTPATKPAHGPSVMAASDHTAGPAAANTVATASTATTLAASSTVADRAPMATTVSGRALAPQASAPGAILSIDGSTGPGAVTILAMRDLDLAGGLGETAGVVVHQARFGSPQSGVAAGAWTVGRSDARIGGDGLSFTAVSGLIAFDDLDLFTDGGDGFVAEGGVGDGLSIWIDRDAAADARIDAIGGAALRFTELHTLSNIAELNASGGHHGLELALVAGAFDVAGGALSTATGHGVLFAGWADVSLSGLTIDGAVSGVEAGLGEGAGFSLGASTITARGAGAAGVRVQSVGGTDATVQFSDLSIASAGVGLAAFSPSGGASDARLTVTGFDDIEIVSAEGFGAALRNVVLAAPDGGAFSAAAVDGYGLVLMDSDGTLGLESVSVSDAAMDGVVVMGGSGVLGLGDVTVSGAGGQGLRVAGYDGALDAGSVSITDSGGTGLAIAAGDGAVTLGDVTVAGAGADAVVIGGSGAGSVATGRTTVSDFGADTALDLSGFDLAGGLVTGAVTLTGDGAAGSLGIDLDGAANGRRIQLGAVAAPDTDTPSAISGVETGVRLGDADVNFSFGDAEGAVDAASSIAASGTLIDFIGLDPSVGVFNFADVTFIGNTTPLAGRLDLDIFYVNSTAGAGTEQDPGSLAQAEASGADAIVLINDGVQLDASGTNGDDSFNLQAGQRLLSFADGDITGLPGVAGAPANIILSTITPRTDFTLSDPTGNGAAVLTGSAGTAPVVNLANDVILQGLRIEAGAGGGAAVSGVNVSNVAIIGGTILSGGSGAGVDLDITTGLDGVALVCGAAISSASGRAIDVSVTDAAASYQLALNGLSLTGASASRLTGAGGTSLSAVMLDSLSFAGAGLAASSMDFAAIGAALTFGSSADRVQGAALSLTGVTGALGLDELTIFNTGGAGVVADNAALGAGDFTLTTAAGAVDTLAGAALDLDTLTLAMTLGSVSAGGGAAGVALDTALGSLTAGSLAVTGAATGVSVIGASGALAFGATTIGAVGAGTGVDLSDHASGAVSFNGAAITGVGAGGLGVDLSGSGAGTSDFGGLSITGSGAGSTGISLSGAGFSGEADTGALSITGVALGVDLTNADITGTFTAGDGSNQDGDGAASVITLDAANPVLAISGLNAAQGVYDFRDVTLTGDTSNLTTNLTLFYASAGGNGAGTAGDFGSLADAETAGADVVILVNDGAALDASGTNGDDTFTLAAGQRLVSFGNGDVTLGGAAPANVLLFGISSGTLADPTGNGAATLTSGFNAVTLGGGNTILGVDLVSTGGAALMGTGFGDLSLSFSTLTGSAGGALLDATGGAGLVRVEDSVFSGASASGFSLTGASGSTLIFERNTVSATGAFAFSASAASAADLTITRFADNTATAGTGGFSFDTLTFGSGAAVNAGALTIGTSAARIAGGGLSLQGVAGALSVTDLQVFTNGGTGARIDNAGLSVGDFTLSASNGEVNALAGAALDFDTATLDLTLDTVTASGGATGIAFDQIAGQAAVTGATTVSTTSGDAVSITNSAATLGFDALTITGAGADGLGVTRSSGDLTVSGALTIDAATAAGARFTDNTGDVVFNGAVVITDTGVVGLSSETVGGAATGSVTFTDGVTLSTGAATAVSLAAGSLSFSGGLDIDTTSGTGLQTTGGVLSIANAGDESITTVTGSALNLQSVAVGAAGLHLDRVAVTGTATGVGARLTVLDTSAGAISIGSLAIAGATGDGLSISDISGANGVSITAADIDNTGGAGVAIAGAASLVNLGAGSANGLAGLSVDGSAGNGLQIGAVSGVVNLAAGSAALNVGTSTLNGGGALVVTSANGATVTVGNGAAQGLVAAGPFGVVLNGGAGGAVTLRNITASDTGSSNGTFTIQGAGAVTLDDLVVTGANTHAFRIENADAVVTATDLSASGFAGSGLSITDDDTAGSFTQAGTFTIAAPGTAGITLAGGATASLGDVDITGLAANTTGVDLTGATGAVTFNTLEIAGVSTTGTVGIDYSNSSNALDVLTTDSGTIQGVGVGVDLTNAAGAGEFQFGDGSNIDMDGAASVIDAVTPITAAGLGAAGTFDFLDVALTGDISAFESALEFFFVDADGADGASPFAAGSEQNPGSIGQAQASGADIIVLVDTTAGAGAADADTIDLADATLGAGGTFTLTTGQQLVSFLNSDTLDFSSAGGGAPSNLFLQGVNVGIIDNPNAGFGAPNLTTSAAGADTLVLADNTVVQGVRLTATSGAGVAVAGSGVTNVRIADSLIAGAAGAFSLDDAAGATELGLFQGVTLSALGGTLVNFDGTGGNGFAVRSFSSNTLAGGGAAGAVFDSVDFDADAGAAGAQTVNAGAWTLGTSLNRISGAGLSMTAATGDLSFTSLDIFNDGGIGLAVANSGQGVSDFTLGVDGGVIDTANGAAIALETLTSDVTLDSVTSTNAAAASAVSLAEAAGAFTVTGATTLSNAGNHGIALDDIDGADMAFDTVSVTGAGLDGVHVGSAATGAVEFFGAVTIDLQSAGDDAIEFSGYDGFVLFNDAVTLLDAGDDGFRSSGGSDGEFNFVSTVTITGSGGDGISIIDAGGTHSFGDTLDIDSSGGHGLAISGASRQFEFADVDIDGFGGTGLLLDTVTGLDVRIASLDINGLGAGAQGLAVNAVIGDIDIDGGLIENIGGAAISLTGGSIVTLTSATSVNAATDALLVVNDDNSLVTFEAGAVFTATGGTGLQFTDADRSYTFQDAVTITGNDDDGVFMDSASSGSAIFNGAVTLSTGTGTAMDLDNGALAFNGGLDIDTTSGAGIDADGGTLSIADAGTETINTATGQALSLDGVAIGAGGFHLDALTVATGTASGDGVFLHTVDTGASGLVIDTLDIDGAADDGIDLADITGAGGLTFTTVSVDGAVNNGIFVSGANSTINLGTGTGVLTIGADAVNGQRGFVTTSTAGTITLGNAATQGTIVADSGGFDFGISIAASGSVNVENFTLSGGAAGVGVFGAGTGAVGLSDITVTSTNGNAFVFENADADVTLTDFVVSGAALSGLAILDDDAIGSVTLNGASTIDGIGAGAGVSSAVDIDDANVSISGLTIGGAGAVEGDGVNILNALGTRTVSLANLTVTALGDGIEVDGAGTSSLVFALDGAVLAADGDAITIDSSASSTAGLTITDFSGITVTGDGADNGGVILTGAAANPIVFDADTGTAGFQAVSGGAGVIGTTANRVAGDALSFTSVEGALGFDDLDVANDGGFGIEVNNAAVVGGKDFTFNVDAGGAADASVDTTNGTALFLDPLTVNMVFDTITAAGGSNGVVLDAFAGSFQVSGATTISNTTGAGLVFSGANTGAATFSGLTTITTPGPAGMEIGATGGLSFGEVDITGLGANTTGVDLTGVSGAVSFTSLDITGASTTDTTGIDLTGAATADDITIAEANISGLALGVDLDTAAITGTFRLGDGEGVTNTASTIGAITALSIAGLDGANGTYDFADVDFGASGISNLQADVYWAAASARGDGDGSTADDAGTLASAAAATTGTIVLLDTAGTGGQDVITGTITLDAAQSLYSFGSGDTLTGLGGAPANLLLTGITSGTVTNPFTGSGGVRLTSADGTATVTAGDGSTLAGLEIFNTGTGAALLANGAAGLTLDGVTLSASGGDGASLTGLTGAISFTNVSVAMTGGSGHGFDFGLASAPSITFDGVTVTTSGAHSGDAVSAAVSGGFAPTFTFANTNVFRGGSNGFALTTADAADSVVLSFGSATTLQGASGAALRLDGFDGTTDTLTVADLSGITVDVAASGGSGGLVFTDLQFDADTGAAGLQTLGAGDLALGSGSSRVEGAGLSFTDVRGALNFGELDIFSAGGTALLVDNAGAATGDFALGATSGVIDATAGAGLDLDTVTSVMSLTTVTAAGGVNGVALNSFTGGLAVTGTTTVVGSSGYGIALTGANTGTATFGGQVTIDNDGSGITGGGVDLDSGTLIFNGGLDVDTLSGVGFDGDGGTLAVADAGTETINTQTGQIITLASVQIAGAGVSFDTLAASGVVTGDALSFGNVDGAGTFNGGAVSVAGTSGGGHGLSLSGGSAANFEFASADIDNVDGSGIVLNGVTGTVTVGSADIDTAGDVGVLLNGANGAVNFTTLNVNGVSGRGVLVSGATNAVTISGGAIGATNDPAQEALRIDGGSAAVTIGASLTKTTGGNIVFIRNRTAGAVTLSGALSATAANSGIDINNNSGGTITLSGASKVLSTGANSAVNLVSNTGATINFTGGGLDIDTTSGIGFSATGGGAVTVQGANNTVTATTGTAVNIASTTIGASGVTLRSVAANGAASGIVLNATGSAGFFSVTGDGATPLRGGNGSGGTIQSATGDGISLTNAANVSLAHMTIEDAAVHGIDASGVDGLVLDGVTLDGNGDHGVNILNGAGVYDFSQLLADGNVDSHVGVLQQSGATSLTSFTIDDSTFRNIATGSFEDGVLIELLDGSSAGAVTVSNSTFSNHDGEHLEVSLNGSASIGTTTVTNNDLSTTVATSNASDGGGLVFNHDGAYSGSHELVISNNTIQDANGASINLNMGDQASASGAGTVSASITGNTLGRDTVAGSGGRSGIDVDVSGGTGVIAGEVTVLIDNNTLREVGADGGIVVQALHGDSSTATINATITRNDVEELLAGFDAYAALYIDARNNNTICVDVGGAGLENTFSSSVNSPADVIFVSRSNAVVNVAGYGGAASSQTALAAYLQSRNSGTPDYLQSVLSGGVIQGGATCPTP